jgi:hypothetical protein
LLLVDAVYGRKLIPTDQKVRGSNPFGRAQSEQLKRVNPWTVQICVVSVLSRDHAEAQDGRPDGHPSAGRAVPGADLRRHRPGHGQAAHPHRLRRDRDRRDRFAGRIPEQIADHTAVRTNVTLRVLLAEWLAGHQVEPSTRASYAFVIDKFILPAIGGQALPALAKLGPRPYERLYAELRTCRRRCSGKPFIEHRTPRRHECDDRCAPPMSVARWPRRRSASATRCSAAAALGCTEMSDASGEVDRYCPGRQTPVKPQKVSLRRALISYSLSSTRLARAAIPASRFR